MLKIRLANIIILYVQLPLPVVQHQNAGNNGGGENKTYQQWHNFGQQLPKIGQSLRAPIESSLLLPGHTDIQYVNSSIHLLYNLLELVKILTVFEVF